MTPPLRMTPHNSNGAEDVAIETDVIDQLEKSTPPAASASPFGFGFGPGLGFCLGLCLGSLPFPKGIAFAQLPETQVPADVCQPAGAASFGIPPRMGGHK